MGKARIWILVEGRSHDRAFYEHVASTILGDEEQYRLRLAETVELNGVAAGGKAHALKLYDHFLATNLLRQESKSGDRSMLFALDQDLDQLSNKVRADSPHLVYTRTADVEAEILAHVDLVRVVAVVFGIPRRDVAKLMGSTQEILEDLTRLYCDWIIEGAIRLCSLEAHWRMLPQDLQSWRFSDLSRFNWSPSSGDFDQADMDLIETVQREFNKAAAVACCSDEVRLLRETLTEYASSGKLWRFLRGRWIAKFVTMRGKQRLSGLLAEAVGSPTVVTKVALSLLPEDGPAIDHYAKKLRALAS